MRGLKGRRTIRIALERSISYYNKGQILGLLLDLAIRDATDDHKSLDDVSPAHVRGIREARQVLR